MRDSHRMKEKWDLSLDSRQVVSMAIGAIVVLGAVFVLGVVVGKGLASSDEVQDAPDLLTALDQRAKVNLTFQDELTRKVTPPLEAPKPVPPPVAVVVPAAAPPAAPPATPAVAAAPAATAPVPPQPAPPAPVAAAAPAVASAPAARDADTGPTPTRSASLKDAFARVNNPAPPKPPADANPEGTFTLQLAASQDRAEADRFVARLRERGYAPYVVTADVAGKGTFFRVRMGSFGDREAAQRYLADFKRETKMDGFVAVK